MSDISVSFGVQQMSYRSIVLECPLFANGRSSMSLNVIITGVTGMVGEGVLMEALQNPAIQSVLAVTRKPTGVSHPKFKELVIKDFFNIESHINLLTGYDACFYCAGISSLGLSEYEYTKITFDTTMHFAKAVLSVSPKVVFDFVSGRHTDSTEKGKAMWARVKGKTENELARMFPGRAYNFRPALMKPSSEQKYLHGYNKWLKILYPIMSLFLPACSIQTLARAMIHTSTQGYPHQILEVQDIKKAAQ